MKTDFGVMDAERSVLGAILLDADAFDRVADILAPDDFAIAQHRHAFEAACELVRSGQPLDAITLGNALDSESLGEPIRWASEAVSTVNVESYARIVRNKAKARRLAESAAKGAGLAQSGDLADAVAVLADACDSASREHASPVKRIGSYWADYADLDRRTGWSTGFCDLDALISLRRGELIVVGARPSIGKSTLLGQLGARIAKRECPSLLFSLEEPGASIYERMLKLATRDDEQLAADELETMPLWVDTSTPATVDQIRARARSAIRRHGIGVVLVDYLQLVDGHGDSREQRVSSVSRGLKSLALGHDVCVIAAAQLNRASEGHFRPRLGDLRESGAIEQDADQVWLLHNDERVSMSVLELEVAKNRNGPKGRVYLRHISSRFRLESMDQGSIGGYCQAVEDARHGGNVADFKTRAKREAL